MAVTVAGNLIAWGLAKSPWRRESPFSIKYWNYTSEYGELSISLSF